MTPPITRDDAAIFAWLEEGPTHLTALERTAIADAAELVAQRRSILPWWRPESRRLVVFATAILAVAVATSVLLIALIGEQSPSPTPASTFVPSGAPVSSDAACSTNAGTAVEWSGRVRTDFAAMATCLSWQEDPRDAAEAGIDIIAVRDTSATDQRFEDTRYFIGLDGYPPAAATLNADETVIEYGLVFETTGDGVADYVAGINNDAPELGDFRVWVTDLASGTTEERLGPPYGSPVEFRHPDEQAADEGPLRPTMMFQFLYLPPWGPPGTVPVRYYAWSSVTSGADVVAWDYAPDVGWLGQSASRPGVGSGEDPFALSYRVPVRVEPPGDPRIQAPTRIASATRNSTGRWRWTDDVGEAEVASEELADLVGLEVARGCIFTETLCVDFTTQTLPGPFSRPNAEWLAYGLDVDADGDGGLDFRLGMDNQGGGLRSWFQDLEAGVTDQARMLDSMMEDSEGYTRTVFPWANAAEGEEQGLLWFGRELAVVEEDGARFYLWSALIRDEELIAWDYAPNDGWLELPPAK